MPPKKVKTTQGEDSKLKSGKVARKTKEQSPSPVSIVQSKQEEPKNDNEKKSTIPQKRKQSVKPHENSKKSPRRLARGASKLDPKDIVRFLLSPDAVDLCRPQDEMKDLKGKDNVKTYSNSVLTPFEELVSAAILSRPISHALGVRTIRTIFNDPYNFTTPKAIQDAGDEKRHQALWDARTQHKDKTAQQLGQMADLVIEKFSNDSTDDSLAGVREASERDMDKESELLTSSIKGIGKTGMSIFFRRVQWLWPECYPYIDDRTAKALNELGLPNDAEEVVKLLDQHWSDLSLDILPDRDLETRKRRAFVILLERATGAELEKNTAQVLEQATKA